jgi:hypothetical protein
VPTPVPPGLNRTVAARDGLQVVVLVMSLCFIGFVTFLHVIGKLYTVRA